MPHTIAPWLKASLLSVTASWTRFHLFTLRNYLSNLPDRSRPSITIRDHFWSLAVGSPPTSAISATWIGLYNQAKMANYNAENLYLALVSMAEEFRTQNPPDIRNCVQCLFAILNLQVPYQAIEAKTHLQIGSLLIEHTNNLDHAKSHLKKAVFLSFLKS